ncbi:hypothetical protein ACIQ1J_35205 [Streptomyces sp. NPDC097107]|uniref:hypothetical protein n=1 Tax=Streptomyces sp. NPDC097107 TaxID=3366089 RepID=UPI003825CF71
MEKRDATLLAFLDELRTVEEIAERRLVCRPHAKGPHAEPAERRTAVRRLDRLIDTGRVTEAEQGTFRAT